MTGIIVFILALFAMFAWFFYLFLKDPANLFKRAPHQGGRRYRREDPDSSVPLIVPIGGIGEGALASSDNGLSSESFTPGGGDFGGAGSSGDWSDDASATTATDGADDSGSGDSGGGGEGDGGGD